MVAQNFNGNGGDFALWAWRFSSTFHAITKEILLHTVYALGGPADQEEHSSPTKAKPRE